PFTDPKRLNSECNIDYSGTLTHEPSSDFVYEVIKQFGGSSDFYSKFYINSVCPLGFTSIAGSGKETNYNYYDHKDLEAVVYNFIIESIEKQIRFGLSPDICFCLGSGINAKFLRKLNNEKKYFGKICALEHPRYVMQYKATSKQSYIEKYISAFKEAIQPITSPPQSYPKFEKLANLAIPRYT
ncbi:MAG: uracil-DNA glycosylase family protein, partial [Sphingobacteriales bacterium]